MTAHAGPAPSGVRTSTSTFSRVYGLGTVFAKTLRDSRLAVIIVAGLVAAFLISGAAAFGEAYSTVQSRLDLANLVKSLPPALSGVYGNPFPVNIETLGGSIGWKSGASIGLMAALWSVLALSGTLAAEARRGSLEFVATTRLGMRRIAVEKLAAHLSGMAIVVVVVALSAWVGGAAFATLPGDEIPLDAAVGFALWVGVVALASGSVAFALAPVFGRGGSAAIAGAVLLVGYFVNGYQAAVPAFAGPANLTWFGWTARHQPLAGQFDWLSLAPGAIVAAILFVIGVELIARRDLGVTTRIPWPKVPERALGLNGPTSRSLGDRLPLATSWGIGIGLMGFIFGAASLSLSGALDQLSPETRQIWASIFPNIDLNGAGAFLQLAFITFGLILAGFAAATLVNGWASDETGGRLEMLLTTPMSRARWAVAGGLGVMAAIAVMTAIITLGIGIGAALAGGDVLTPILGSMVLGLYAAALAGIGLAVGGLFRTSIAGEAVAGIVIVTFVIDVLAPALKWPDWVHQLALSSHLGQPMVGTWDWPGMIACVVIAIGGVVLAGVGIARRDVEH
ncbi:MAG: ABC transporter permease subunit [Chloroflexi bacterium]|nr:ABC transporter permease subunit [Chloroflexota bacterium]